MTASLIDELLLADVEWIEAQDSVRHAKRRLENAALRSLIVVQDERPVGIIKRRALLNVEGEELEKPVTEYMVAEFPTLKRGDTITDAQERMGHDVDVEQIPVISDSGELISAVHREHLAHTSTPASESREAAGTGPAPELAPVKEGMTVKDASGSKLGSFVEADFTSQGDVEFFVVEHGLIFKKQKRLPGDLIREIEGDDIHLRIDSMEWGMMRDIDDEAP